MTQPTIVIHWKTRSFRAFFVRAGCVVDRRVSDDGIVSVGPGQHQAILTKVCGDWLRAHPKARVALVGMVGSRDGWTTAPYVSCPAGLDDISRHVVSIGLRTGQIATLMPGAACEMHEGTPDVMRGEEMMALGAGLRDGLLCIPGQHSKWVQIRDGKIARFQTFVTGELHHLLCNHSSLGRGDEEMRDPAGFERGLAASLKADVQPSGFPTGLAALFDTGPAAPPRGAGLLHALFAAEAGAAAGRLTASEIATYLWGLLVGEEIVGGLRSFGHPPHVVLVADDTIRETYQLAFARMGVAVTPRRVHDCLVGGVLQTLDVVTAAPAQHATLLWPAWAG